MWGITNTPSLQSDYEPATKHFLLIGFLAMFCSSIVFAVYCFKKMDKRQQENMVFLATAASTLFYYLMWSGFGVMHKLDSEGGTREVFWARYLDRFVTGPLLLYSLADLCQAELPEVLMLVSVDFFMTAAAGIGSTELHPWKWIWWTIGMAFFVVLAIQVFGIVNQAKQAGNPLSYNINILALLLLLSWLVYDTVWVLGEEGLGAISISLEVGFVVLADLVSKIAYGLFLIFVVLPQKEEGSSEEETSLV